MNLCKLTTDSRTANTVLSETEALVKQLYHHHASQAKPHTEPASKQYNAELAAKCKNILGY
ncbi:hypothetical protein [Methylotenera sp.]|uniref:hypothetical protein n=1 Tax=Methylotenera sp. TaxID=2051956 RepID=UPI00248A57C3|nr:hypothetical protein [Methylotenera sp.]MDI1362548.1 hypothetical protein [Methylotenera sp.]